MTSGFDYLKVQRQEWEQSYLKFDNDRSELTAVLDKFTAVAKDLEISGHEFAQYPIDDPLSVEYAIHRSHVEESLMEVGDEVRVFLTNLPDRSRAATVPPLSPLRHRRGSFVGMAGIANTMRSDKSEGNSEPSRSQGSPPRLAGSAGEDDAKTSDDVFSFNESVPPNQQVDLSHLEAHEVAARLMQERYQIQEKLERDQRDLERIITRLNRHQNDLNGNRQAVDQLNSQWQQHEKEIDEQIGRAINFRNVSEYRLPKQEGTVPKSRSGFCRLFQSR